MRAVWIISKRELQSFFDSLIAYILLTLFLGFSGFFTWMFGNDVFLVGQASLRSFFGIAYWTLFFFAPALSGLKIMMITFPGAALALAPGSDLQPFQGWPVVTVSSAALAAFSVARLSIPRR